MISKRLWVLLLVGGIVPGCAVGLRLPGLGIGIGIGNNGRALPDSYMRNHPEVFECRDARILFLHIEPLLRDLGLERIERVGINQLSGVARFTYRSGLTVPQQRVVVRPAP